MTSLWQQQGDERQPRGGAPESLRDGWLAGAEEASDAPDTTGANESLEDAARDEQEYLRERLRLELDREPTGEEMDEWLPRHTGGQ